MQQAIGELTGFVVKVSGTSRTDAGVSALGQVVNFIIKSPVPTENFVKALNHRLPRDIKVLEASEVPLDFDASSSAKSKLYRYKIFTGKNRQCPAKSATAGIRPGELDVAAMDAAAKMLVGTHDFKSFAAAADKRETSSGRLSAAMLPPRINGYI